MLRSMLLALSFFAISVQAADPVPTDEPTKKPAAPGWRERVAPVTTTAASAGDAYGLVQDGAKNALTTAQQADAAKVNAARRLWLARKGLLKAEQTLVTQASTGSKAARKAAASRLQQVRKQMAKMPEAKVDPKWAQRMETLGGLGELASITESYRSEGSWGVLKDRTHSSFQGATMGLAGLKGAEVGAYLGFLAAGPPGAVVGGSLGGAGGMLVAGAGYQYGAKPIVDKNLDEFGKKSGQLLRTPLQAAQRATGLAGGAPATLTPEAEKQSAEAEQAAKEAAEKKRKAEEAAERARKKPGKPADKDTTDTDPRDKGTSDKGTSDKDTPDKGTSDKGTSDKGTPDKGTGGKDPDKDTPSTEEGETDAGDKGEKSPGSQDDNGEDNSEDNGGDNDEDQGDETENPPTSTAGGDEPPRDRECNPEVPGPCFNQRHDRSGDQDERALWEGFDSDPGNLDGDRVAANGGRASAPIPENWRPSDTTPQGNQQDAAPGTRIGESYTANPINDAERDRELAEQAERIAAAGNPLGDRGRERGDSIAQEFGSAPDTGNLPDPNRRSSQNEGDRKPTDAQPPAPEPKPPTPAPKPPVADKPGQPAKPPTAGKPPAAEKPPAPEKPSYD